MWSEGPRGVAWPRLPARRRGPRGGRLWTLRGGQLCTFQKLPQTATLASCSASEAAAQDAQVCAAMGRDVGREHVWPSPCSFLFLCKTLSFQCGRRCGQPASRR